MSREYEFRAWLKDKKVMANVPEICFAGHNVTLGNEHDYETMYFDEIELMLGLKIYDEVVFVGDVVRIYGGEQMFGYYEFDKIKVIKKIKDLLMLFNVDCEIDVLGNIYENPELLEAA